MVQKSHSQPPFGCFRKPVNNEIFTISTGEFAGFLVAINSMYCFVNSILWSQRWRVITNGLGEKFSGRIRDGRGAAQQSGKSQVIGFGFSVRNWEWQWPKLAGGNSKIFLFSSLIWGRWTHFDEYFSIGLKPPTRKAWWKEIQQMGGPLAMSQLLVATKLVKRSSRSWVAKTWAKIPMFTIGILGWLWWTLDGGLRSIWWIRKEKLFNEFRGFHVVLAIVFFQKRF